MDSWCELLTTYPDNPEPRHLSKALRTADTLLSIDLAPYEIEWLVQTFLFKPIDALNMIITKRVEEEWHKNTADIFRAISKIVVKYWTYLKEENEKLVQVCLLPFDPQTKKEAIYCLINITKNAEADVGDAVALVHALESDTTCKAPLALLIGSLCRYYPERVDQNYNRIWRIYLNMLQVPNKTDTILSAVLQGIDGLLENFGRDISIQELQYFYKDLSRKCAKINKCIEPLLSILKSHAGLFREKLVEDKVLRLYIWGLESPNIKDSLIAIYTVVFADVPPERIKEIISSEVRPYTMCVNSVKKHTALRIIIYAKKYCYVETTNIPRPDDLEFQIRYRPISYQETDLVSLSLESKESYVKSLLMSVIMYYDHIPVSLRKDILVKRMLDVSEDVRKMALTLLIELCKQDGCLDRYAEVWREILDAENIGDTIFVETLQCFASILKSFVDNSIKDIDQVTSLSNVLCFVLSVGETDLIPRYSDLIRPVIAELSAGMSVCPSVILSSKYLCIEMFKSKSILKELLSTFIKDGDNDMLAKIQMVFKKDSVDAKLLIKALSQLDVLLKSGGDLDQRQVTDIMNMIVKLKYKKTDDSSTDSRVFRRNLNKFIGEHKYLISKENFNEEIYSLELKNKIILNIPNNSEGNSYKIDLLRILQISLSCDDYETLYCLLVIISANLRDRPEPSLQSVTWGCVHALCRSGADVDVTSSLRMCVTAGCVQRAVHSIRDERSPEVRKKLCDSLLVMLLQDPGSEITGQLLTLVAEEMLLMIKSTDELYYGNGVEIAEVFIKTLQNDDNLTIEYLPKIVTLTSRKICKDSYKTLTDLFIEKLDIFDEHVIKQMISDIVECMVTNQSRLDLELILAFVKRIFDVKCYDSIYFVEEILQAVGNSDEITGDVNTFHNILQILSLSKNILDFTDGVRKSIVTVNNSVLMEKIANILDNEINITVLKNVLKFIKEYAMELLDVKRDQIVECFSKLIENITPESVLIIKNDLSVCLCTYKSILQVLPDKIINSYKKWCEKLNLKEITYSFYDPCDSFAVCDTVEKYSDTIHLLSVVSTIFDYQIPDCASWTSLLINDKILRKYDVLNMLIISEKCLTSTDFDEMLEFENVGFVRKYMSVYFKRILERDVHRSIYSMLFNDVIIFFGDNYKNYERYYDTIVELLKNMWPSFEEIDFDSQLSIASAFFKLPRTDIIPLLTNWAKTLITRKETSLNQKILVTSVLPGGESYSVCYRYMAGLLPIRLSEVQGDHAAILRCLLDSLATSGDLTLLDIIVTLAAADDTKGWWDDAMDACMASLADRRDEKIFDAAYKSCKKRSGLGGCRRVFVPLLKHSTRTFCEEYSCKIIVDLLSTFKSGFNEPSNSDIYKERILSYARAFSILQVIIDKVPANNLECGIINMSAGYQDPWHVIKDVCVYSMTLRDKVRCPDDATDIIKDACLRLQCAAYNCLTAAICKRRPSQKQYAAVFNVTAWSKVVDPDVVYDFPPKAFWNDYRMKRNSTSSGTITGGSTSKFTGTVRTRLFMATLSENPLQFDMIPNDDDEEEVEDVSPERHENHPLNDLGVLSSVTGVLGHAATLQHHEWLVTVAQGLTTLHLNAKWTLAQAICNAELDLKPHADALAPAMLQLVANTTIIRNEQQVLNNLHIDVLWTVMRWEVALTGYDDMNLCIQHTISTCIEHRSNEAVARRLLSTLDNLLQRYRTKVDVKWSFLNTYCDDLPNNSPYLLPILQRILKNGIPLPGLFIVYEKFEPRQWISTSRFPEVFGLALSLEANKEPHLNRFWQVLASVKSINIVGFVKMLLYSQRVCWQCCNLQYIRIIADLAPKVEKSKCLSIISTYLDNLSEDDDFCREMFDIIGLKELLDGDYMLEAMKVVHGGLKFMDETMRSDLLSTIFVNCKNSSVKIRKQACSVVLKVFQDIVIIKKTYTAKRRAMEYTAILDTYSQSEHHRMMLVISDGIFDDDEQTAKMMRDGIEECLSKDMAIRFAELFYIIFYFTKNDFTEVAELGHVFLDLLFRDMRQQEGFKDRKLSDRPLPNDADSGFTAQTTVARIIDVQMPVADILEAFLHSTKINSEICQEFLVEIMRRMKGTGRRFDLDAFISKLLGDIMKKEPNCLTPLFIEASRIFLNHVQSVDGFKDTLDVLRQKILSSDSVAYLNILYEDLLLKTEGRNLFNFSVKEELDVDMEDESQQFSIQGLTEVFGRLSNWDDLRIQDRDRIERTLPQLLVEHTEFERSIEEYYDERLTTLDYRSWFNKMLGSYCTNKLFKPIIQYKEHWLRDIERWPSRDFVTSAVIEAMKWPADDDDVMPCKISSSDCLAELAARLMIRSSYYGDDAHRSVMCRGDELKFCREANSRKLPKLALQCIERNKNSLLENEALSWFHEKVVAHRILALAKNDTSMLQRALEAAESQNTDENICLQKLVLQLRRDLGILSQSKLDDILTDINKKSIKNTLKPDKGVSLSSKNAETLKCIYDLAMDYYDDLWDANDTSTQTDIISKMVDVIQKRFDHNLFKNHNVLISILLNKLTHFDGTLSEDTARKVLDLITLLLPKLDTYNTAVIRSITNTFPADIPCIYNDADRDQSLLVCKQYLQLICDPQYVLLHYCDKLFYAKDQENYKTIFNSMKLTLFTNSHGGTEYRSLNTIRNKLFNIEFVDNVVARHKVLKPVIEELKSKAQRSVVRLSQLSPELSKSSVLEGQKNSWQTLLALPPSVYVVKFMEQIQLFRDSIRRPCVLTALLSNGTNKRYIIKSGEPLANDASVQRCIAILPELIQRPVKSYNVTTLSDDAAVIEYLEDHERLRELMGDAVNVSVNQRLADDKLVLSPSLALEQYKELCNKVPVNTLRSAIENRCASVQEFIYKNRMFLETLSTMTITNWLFGVGDRHLHNIMLAKSEGAVCGVDWGSALQYGAGERLPARLTHNVLAVCDVTVLESRLQSVLLSLRENRKLYESYIQISFHWKGRDFREMSYIRNILRGNMVSYEVTKNVLQESNLKLKHEYIKTLDSVFKHFTNKQTYSVEEQISCLLKHCTDEKLLSITPQGWEGWL